MRTAKTDQMGRMPRLIWVFAGRTCHFVGFVMKRLILLFVRIATYHEDHKACQVERRSSLIRVYTVCHSVCIFWTHYCSVWLGQAMMLGSFQCHGVLLLWNMIGQGPAVLAAGAGRVGCFLIFSSHLSYFPFLMPHLLGDGWTFWNIVVSAVIT